MDDQNTNTPVTNNTTNTNNTKYTANDKTIKDDNVNDAKPDGAHYSWNTGNNGSEQKASRDHLKNEPDIEGLHKEVEDPFEKLMKLRKELQKQDLNQ